jgi:hypothetical protein
MRQDPPSHHIKQKIGVFFFLMFVVSPFIGLGGKPVALFAQSAQAAKSFVPTT